MCVNRAEVRGLAMPARSIAPVLRGTCSQLLSPLPSSEDFSARPPALTRSALALPSGWHTVIGEHGDRDDVRCGVAPHRETESPVSRLSQEENKRICAPPHALCAISRVGESLNLKTAIWRLTLTTFSRP